MFDNPNQDKYKKITNVILWLMVFLFLLEIPLVLAILIANTKFLIPFFFILILLPFLGFLTGWMLYAKENYRSAVYSTFLLVIAPIAIVFLLPNIYSSLPPIDTNISNSDNSSESITDFSEIYSEFENYIPRTKKVGYTVSYIDHSVGACKVTNEAGGGILILRLPSNSPPYGNGAQVMVDLPSISDKSRFNILVRNFKNNTGGRSIYLESKKRESVPWGSNYTWTIAQFHFDNINQLIGVEAKNYRSHRPFMAIWGPDTEFKQDQSISCGNTNVTTY